MFIATTTFICGAISKPMTLPLALAFQTTNVETVVHTQNHLCVGVFL